MELSDSQIKKISYIFSKESFSYISGNGTLHFLSPGSKNKKIYFEKNFYIFSKESFSYTPGNGTFLIFQELTF